MKPEFESYGEGGAALRCPCCGSIYLRHEVVEVFERSEDAEIGWHVTVKEREVMADTNLSGNPSTRRHGLLVHFSCEGCEAISTLSLGQHKGITYIELNLKE